jgi:hypothetical protein
MGSAEYRQTCPSVVNMPLRYLSTLASAALQAERPDDQIRPAPKPPSSWPSRKFRFPVPVHNQDYNRQLEVLTQASAGLLTSTPVTPPGPPRSQKEMSRISAGARRQEQSRPVVRLPHQQQTLLPSPSLSPPTPTPPCKPLL